MAAIRLEAVRKVYGSDVLALSDFSLDISDGEFVVFVGPSGCGKSTALKILAGLEATTSGRVSIGGEDVTDLAPGKRDIAMVFQNYALYPHLSVRKNIGFGLKVRGTPKPEIDRRVDEVAKILGITALLGRRPRALSGGQRQRVALGRAIVREPQAFLMDEPLSNLDARLRVQMRAEISALHDRLKVTTIYVTHDQTEAMTMADRIVIMRDGIIQQVAEPDEMYEQPANIFVAGFIGSPAMNFFQSTVERTGDGLAVKLGETVLPIRSRAGVQQGQPVIVGLRPESIGNSADAHVAIEIEPRLVESLGGERYLYFPVPEANAVSLPAVLETDERNSGMMIARILGNRRIRAGEPVRLTVDPAQLHLFDPGSERALGG